MPPAETCLADLPQDLGGLGHLTQSVCLLEPQGLLF